MFKRTQVIMRSRRKGEKMIEKMKVLKLDHYPQENVVIDGIGKKNLIVGRNGFGKTTLLKAIRKNIMQGSQNEVLVQFSKEFFEDPKHVFFTIPEELDGRAVRDSVNPYESDTFVPRTIKSMQMSEMSSGQEQKDILEMFKNKVVYDGCIWFIDEPEKSMDIVELDRFLEYIHKLDAQVFINTHSPMLLSDERFNKIVLDQEYAQKMGKILGLDVSSGSSDQKKEGTRPTIKVEIIESERGWGQKVDETKEFETLEEAESFVKEYNAENKWSSAPDWYMYARIKGC